MAKHRYPDQALKAVLEADTALTADDLTKLAGVEASAAELNYVDGLACVKTGQWEVLDYRGTWSVEG